MFLKHADPAVAKVAEKISSGARLSVEDGLALLGSPGLSATGFLANQLREKMHGRATTFSVNRHINYSNVCVNRCAFCAFRKSEGESGADRLSVEEVVGKAGLTGDKGNIEVHITGSLDPLFSLEDAVRMVSEVRKARPNAIVKAFTLTEIDFFSARSGLPPGQVMLHLKNAGVEAFPGGGAEIFSERTRKSLCGDKISGERWLELAGLAHSLGIRTNATMLYGVGESDEERMDHLSRLRSLQDETRGFMAFIPLLFQKEKTALKGLRSVGMAEQLKVYAVSRLFLDNIPHIKAHWVMSGLAAAEVSQWFGVDDIEGTVVEERIGHEGGARTPGGLTRDAIISLIKRAGRTPVERDGLYNKVPA